MARDILPISDRPIPSSASGSRRDFDILEDRVVEAPPPGLNEPGSDFMQPRSTQGVKREILEELSVEQFQNRAPNVDIVLGNNQGPCLSQRHFWSHDWSGTNLHKSKPRLGTQAVLDLFEAQVPLRTPRRRPAIELETFQPLDVVQEESSVLIDDTSTTSSSFEDVHQPICNTSSSSQLHPQDLLADDHLEASLAEQVEKHLRGQFNWLASCPLPSELVQHPSGNDTRSCHPQPRIYGCNLLRSQRPLDNSLGDANSDFRSAITHLLLATPIEHQSVPTLDMDDVRIYEDGHDDPVWSHSPTIAPLTLKVPEIVQAVEHALSPSLTFVSDRSFSVGGRSSRSGSFSLSRIEDSLEELDRLEEEIEALDEIARPQRVPFGNAKLLQKPSEHPPYSGSPKTAKRATVAGLPSTVRASSPTKSQPSLSRSSSLNMRGNRLDHKPSHSYLDCDDMRSKITSSQLQTGKPVPNLNSNKPVDAASRRLRDKQESRLSQQGNGQRTAPSMLKSQTGRPPKSSFELPGEAISRRKREEREAKLRAEEEEERRRREFKARPLKHYSVPSTVPRDTVASRARQAKIQEDSAEKQASLSKAKRLSIGPSRPISTPSPVRSQSVRVRGNTSSLTDSSARPPSTLTRSMSLKRSPARALPVAQPAQEQHHCGRAHRKQDSARHMLNKEQEKREREIQTKAAREEAAERSRIASRQWAEKRRHKTAG